MFSFHSPTTTRSPSAGTSHAKMGGCFPASSSFCSGIMTYLARQQHQAFSSAKCRREVVSVVQPHRQLRAPTPPTCQAQIPPAPGLTQGSGASCATEHQRHMRSTALAVNGTGAFSIYRDYRQVGTAVLVRDRFWMRLLQGVQDRPQADLARSGRGPAVIYATPAASKLQR